MKAPIVAGLLCFIAIIGAAPAEAARVWYEWGIARVTAGADPQTQRFIERKFYVVTYGPDTPGPAFHENARRCTAIVTKETGEALRKQLLATSLPDLPDLGSSPPDRRKLAAEVERRYKSLDEAMAEATAALQAGLTKTCRKGMPVDQFALGLVQRLCMPGKKDCENAPTTFADDPVAKAFSLVLEWINARNPKHHVFPVNHMVVLVEGKPTEADAKRFANFIDTNEWPPAPTLEQMQTQFEEGVRLMRANRKKFEYSVPRVMGLPQEVALQVVDTLDSPREAITRLNNRAGATLKRVSDEIARTRLLECAKYRGLEDAAKAAECAGYSVDDAALASCLRGDVCRPALRDKAVGTVIAYVESLDVKQLGKAALLPRMNLGRFDGMVETYQACAKKHPGKEKKTADCLMKQAMQKAGPKEAKIYECFHEKGRTRAAVECAVADRLTPDMSLGGHLKTGHTWTGQTRP
jgi:hypothetical protein